MRLLVLALVAGLATPALAREHPEMTPAAIAADRTNFRRCLSALWPEAERRGVSRAVFDRELSTLEPEMRLLESMSSQPEFERPIWAYVDGLVSEARIADGRRLIAQHGDLLRRIEQRFGVDRYVLVALWAVESNYGRGMGTRPLVRSTATLACIGRRKAYFRGELLAALRILTNGDIASEVLRGSWAGAFGQTQFMPSTFLAHAVDFDGDGRRDLIGSVADALASTANLLRHSGWQAGKTWGYEVALPERFDLGTGLGRRLAIARWHERGVRRPNVRDFPRLGDDAVLTLPAGARGPAFLLLHNFEALRRYNGSEPYAYAVGHLADRLRGGGSFARAWPTDMRPLSRAERVELQDRLTRAGLLSGANDGRMGARTREAVRQFQQRTGMTPDGFPTGDVLRRLRGTAALSGRSS